MANQRFGITQIDQTRHQLERIVESDRGRETAFDAHGHQRAWVATEIFLSQGMVRTIRKADIIDPGNIWMSSQEGRDLSAIFDMAFHPQRHGLDSLKQQEGAQRGQDRTSRSLVDAAATRNICSLAKMIG